MARPSSPSCRLFVAAIVAGALVGGTSDASACSMQALPRFVPSGEAEPPGWQGPEVVEVSVGEIERGRGSERSGCSESATSCDDIGVATVEILNFDPRFGYRFEFSHHTADGPRAPGFLVDLAGRDGVASFVWSDGATDRQGAVNFEVVVTAVDAFGNESEPSEPVTFFHPGRRGCSARAGHSAALPCLLMAGALVARSRRRRRSEG